MLDCCWLFPFRFHAAIWTGAGQFANVDGMKLYPAGTSCARRNADSNLNSEKCGQVSDYHLLSTPDQGTELIGRLEDLGVVARAGFQKYTHFFAGIGMRAAFFSKVDQDDEKAPVNAEEEPSRKAGEPQ